MSEWKAIETVSRAEDGPSVLLWNQQMADDFEYPGHPYVVCNQPFIGIRSPDELRALGYTHWCPLPSPPKETKE